MEKNESISSNVHNDLNNISLEKTNTKEEKNTIKKEEFKQTNPNYHSGIIERNEIKKKTKPSILIIFIIILAIFFGEVIYNSITNKDNETTIPKNNTTVDNDKNDSSINEEH